MRRPFAIAVLPLLLAGIFFMHMAVTTSFWRETLKAFSNDEFNYSQRRAQYGFQGLTFDEIRMRLNEILPGDTGVALSPQLLKDAFFVQRVTESIYPRLVDHTARNQLDIAPVNPKITSADTLVLQLGQNGLFLRGPIVRNTAEPQLEPDWDWSVLKFVACLLAALGLGVSLWAAFLSPTPLPPPMLPGVCVLLGALFITGVTNILTYAQISAPQGLPATLGLLGLLAVLAAVLRGKTKLPRQQGPMVRPQWESWLFAAVLLVIFARLVEFPITQWDGRSIWFFNARRIFVHGMFLKSDITLADALWSHPDYPLLFPAWSAFFSSFSPVFNERMASLGIPVLLAGTLSLLWQLARKRMGRWPGAALALGMYFAVDHATAGGYADGFLMFFLLIEFLAFSLNNSSLETVAWIAAMAASLLKAEGIILAGVIALVFTAFRTRRGFRPFLLFAPALLHKVWISTLGIDSLLKGKSVGDAIADFIPRLGTALTLAPSLWASEGYTQLHALLWDGLCGLLITLALLAILQKAQRLVQITLVSALLMVLFAFGSISLLPEDISWFVGTALDRLLLHPAALLTLLPFLFLVSQKGANAKAN